MNLTDRLTKITEVIYPYPVKACTKTKNAVNAMRFSRVIRWMKTLSDLPEENREGQIKEWEKKYEVHG